VGIHVFTFNRLPESIAALRDDVAKTRGDDDMTVVEGRSPAIAEFTTLLGPTRVIDDPQSLRAFHDPYQHPSVKAYKPSTVLCPTTVEEIQTIVRIANRHEVPLWTIGQGRNNAYGGPAPRVSGSVVVSLRDMNRVLEIDPELGYAVVEPGVRWFDLYEAIQAGGHRLMLSLTDLGWGSVIGNTLEHGLTYMPYGLDWSAQCGMEVILPSGELMRTGMGAMEGNRSWHVYKRGLGPTPDQMFMQSNFGIVTKMGVWLMPEPEVYMPIGLRTWREEDLPAIVDTLRALMLDGTIRMAPQLNNALLLAALTTSRRDWWDGDGAIPDAVIDRIARELETGRWNMALALYDDHGVVDLRFEKIKRAFEAAVPGAEVWGSKHSPREVADLEQPAARILGGVPNLDWLNMPGWHGGDEGGHLDLAPVTPLTGRDAAALRDLLRTTINAAGLDYMSGIVPINARSAIHVTMTPFDLRDEAQTQTAYDVTKELVVKAAAAGYGEYRAHLDFMDLASEQYGFNNHAYRRFNETIKDALDPNGILAPGKQGIWPRAYRTGARSKR
jgi:4-cresol dehydrogenase (hydroxylating)